MERNASLSAIDLYMNRVFRIVIITTPLSALGAGVCFSGVRMLGYYNEVSWKTLFLFDLSCLLYVAIGVLFYLRCNSEDGTLKPNALRGAKVFLAFVMIIQWNFISYMIPSRDFWAFALFFVLLSLPFLDHKFVLLIEAEAFVSIAISWVLKGSVLLPFPDAYFVPNVILRFVLLGLGFFSVWFITYLIQTRLVAELERIAGIDTLTLLRNRRGMDQALADAIKTANQTGRGFTLIMCDLDDFKAVNDSYGHKCGDEVLKHVASIISHDVNENDLVFRYGGEEILMLINADESIAMNVARRIHTHIQKGSVIFEGNCISVTMTMGAVRYRLGFTAEELIHSADIKLYQGKRNGKNQLVI